MTVIPLLLTISSAILYILSFPPFALSPFMWVAVAPFLLAVSMARPSFAAVYGVLWGVVMTCGVAWCFPKMLADYFGLSTLAGWLGLFAVGIGLTGLYFGAFASWLSWLVRRQAANPLLIAVGWGACEFARANLIIGNPWALSGYSQVALTRLIQVADATGPYGVGMLIAAVNACIAGLFAPPLRGRRPAVSFLGVVMTLSVTLGYGEWRLSQTFATGKPVQIAVIQGGMERQFRESPEYIDANLAHYLRLTKEAAATHPTLVFWPEFAVAFPLQRELPQSKQVFDVVRDLGIDLILGGPYYRFGVKDIYNRNSVFLVRQGKLTGRYDKLRLVPFAEEDQLGWLASHNRLVYEPGRRLSVLPTAAARVGAFVCFEAMYPDFVRGFARQGAEVLANPANDDWFDHAVPARYMLDMASVRAIENRRYLVRPTTTGFSAVIDPHGRTVALSGFGTPAILTASIHPSQVQTPYQLWGDAVSWVAIAVVVAVSLLQVWRLLHTRMRTEALHELPISIF